MVAPSEVPPGRVPCSRDSCSAGFVLAFEADPSSVTVVPSGTDWSGPASATGGPTGSGIGGSGSSGTSEAMAPQKRKRLSS